MNSAHYEALMADDDFLSLSAAEIAEGWHFCSEWDGLLVGPGMGELNECHCLDKEHPVYKKIPPEEPESAPEPPTGADRAPF